MPTIGSSPDSVTPGMPHGSELVNEQPKAGEDRGGKTHERTPRRKSPS